MTKLIIGFSLMFALPAAAKEAAQVAMSDQIGYIRVLGRLNVNTCSRAQLEQVPGLDSTKVDAVLRARSQAPIGDLGKLELSEDVLNHLKTDGDSNLYRIRQNPLRRVDQSPASAAR
jgi:hypothetical protein